MNPVEHPLSLWLEKQFEESAGDHLVLQVIAKGAMYMGPVTRTDVPGVYQVHTPVQLQQDQPPIVCPVAFSCDTIVGLLQLPEMDDKKRIVTQ